MIGCVDCSGGDGVNYGNGHDDNGLDGSDGSIVGSHGSASDSGGGVEEVEDRRRLVSPFPSLNSSTYREHCDNGESSGGIDD